MTRKKIRIPIREGKPTSCIVCGGILHIKSEHYCSPNCQGAYKAPTGKEKPPFLSKWKIRKTKEAKDPLISIRSKIRTKTNDLLRRGKLVKRPCLVCGSKDVLPHHEDYSNPFKVIWLCEQHHKEYHDGKISLFNGKLKWDPGRLIPKTKKVGFPKKKYQQIEKSFYSKSREQGRCSVK